MPPFIFLFLALAFLVCAFALTMYRQYRQARNRAWEKNRNQFHDRV